MYVFSWKERIESARARTPWTSRGLDIKKKVDSARKLKQQENGCSLLIKEFSCSLGFTNIIALSVSYLPEVVGIILYALRSFCYSHSYLLAVCLPLVNYL